jgi:hypothetical protein
MIEHYPSPAYLFLSFHLHFPSVLNTHRSHSILSLPLCPSTFTWVEWPFTWSCLKIIVQISHPLTILLFSPSRVHCILLCGSSILCTHFYFELIILYLTIWFHLVFLFYIVSHWKVGAILFIIISPGLPTLNLWIQSCYSTNVW